MSETSDWKLVLAKFIKPWWLRKDVVGAVVCGSYITGNPTKHSDIDVQIILKKGTKIRERGNVIIDGIMVEYFANPVERHVLYAQEDLDRQKRVSSHMFLSGKVLFDKTGDVRKIIAMYKKYSRKKFSTMSVGEIERYKYVLWDMQDNLEEIYEASGKDFNFVYFSNLREIFNIYAKFCCLEKPSAHKIYRFITNKKDQDKYDIDAFSDGAFISLFQGTVLASKRTSMMKQYVMLTKHVLKKMGGFNINGWKIKSKDGPVFSKRMTKN